MTHSAPSTTPSPSPTLSFTALLTAVLLLGGCTPADDAVADPTQLPLLTLAEPTLEIGVVEGDEAYTFATVDDVLRLANGSVAVSDAGSTRISIYDPAGTFVRSWGSRGEGPGEFRTLTRIYARSPDSLMAADGRTAMLSVFDLQGEFAHQLDGLDVSRDSTFRLDSWLYGRFWVEGALDAAARDRVKATLDGLPAPRAEPGYRVVRVAADGDLWVREPDSGAGSDATNTWTRLGADGQPLAVVETPTRFTPLDIERNEVLGRWIGPADVQFVRAYPISETGETRSAPAWLLGTETPMADTPPLGDDEFTELMRQAIMSIASAQEIHYSTAYTYTTATDSLRYTRGEPPEELGISFTHADPRGWAAVFTHPGRDRLCGLAYGSGAPPGWVPGMIICGPPAAEPPSGA